MSFKRQLYLFHRWAGIVLCLFFALWFLSGLFMMYVEFPQLAERERRAGAAPLDFATAKLTPAEAVATLRAGDFAVAGTPSKNIDLGIADPSAAAPEIERIQLGMVADRPIYRIEAVGKAQPRVVFADDGTVLRSVSPHLAREELSGFLRRAGRDAPLSYRGIVQTDQWTVSSAMNPHRPLHQFALADAQGSVFYVSSSTGEVVRDSSRQERVLNYFGAVTHWLYPTVIRRYPDAWDWLVDIVSSVGTVLAITGIWIGVLRWKRRPGRGVSPYKGVMRWHHFTGLAFGTVTMTWVFSGLLSMNPGNLNPPRSPSKDERLVLSGKPLTPGDFALPRPEGLGRQMIEAELLHYDAQPYLKCVARDGSIQMVPLAEHATTPAAQPEKLYAKLRRLKPEAPLSGIELLDRYDDYYYSRRPGQGGKVLPVVRVRFHDEAQTWFHVDLLTGQVLERSTHTNRVYRWLYNGLHSFDILWLWERRPLWDIVVIAFSLGGLALSTIGMVIGIKRLKREWRRPMRSGAVSMSLTGGFQPLADARVFNGANWMTAKYDSIGINYAQLRKPDPRMAAAIQAALGQAETVLNVGAGTGSYEPVDRQVTAVEPSLEMIRQRSPSAAKVIQASAEDLPFDDDAFDASMAILTIHHWRNKEVGLREMRRVTRGRIVLLTFDPSHRPWLTDYLPELATLDEAQMPAMSDYQRWLGAVKVAPVLVPHDCTDGFLYAYWRRPEVYLDARIRSGSSSFWAIGNAETGLQRLRQDLETGEWERRYAELLIQDAYDAGYRLVVAD